METLIKLAHLLNSNHIKWAVGGSTLLKLSGIDINVNDLDIMIHESDFENAKTLLKTVAIECEIKESSLFKTKYYRKFKWDDTEIDCMSGISLNLSEGYFEYYFDHKDREVEINNEFIPLCYIEDWLILYHLMPNRASKIQCLEEYFTHHSINMNRINTLLTLNIPKSYRTKIDKFLDTKEK